MFAKILVCIHLALSLLLATAAMVLFTNRVDFTDTKGKDLKSDGRLLTLRAEYERSAKFGARPAEARWRPARANLASSERWRPYERAWYTEELRFLDTGVDVDKDKKVQGKPKPPKKVEQLRRNATGDLVFDPAARIDPPQDESRRLLALEPLKGKNPDQEDWQLKTMTLYNQEFNTLSDEVTAAIKAARAANERNTRATEELTSDKEKGRVGLHARLEFEQVKQARIKNEFDVIRPLWLNTAVELNNLDQVKKRLEKRLQELSSKRNDPQ